MGRYAYVIEQASLYGQDRLAVFEIDGYIILLLADGAGGAKGAEQVSEKYIEFMIDRLRSDTISRDSMVAEQMMRDVDLKLFPFSDGCESTAIVIFIKGSEVWGASVGDSRAWVFNDEFEYELTKNQYCKPMLGSGRAIPVGFGPILFDGFVVVGSDGLFNYTSISHIKEKLDSVELVDIPKSLVDLVRLASGNLQDDCSVIVYKT